MQKFRQDDAFKFVTVDPESSLILDGLEELLVLDVLEELLVVGSCSFCCHHGLLFLFRWLFLCEQSEAPLLFCSIFVRRYADLVIEILLFCFVFSLVTKKNVLFCRQGPVCII